MFQLINHDLQDIYLRKTQERAQACADVVASDNCQDLDMTPEEYRDAFIGMTRVVYTVFCCKYDLDVADVECDGTDIRPDAIENAVWMNLDEGDLYQEDGKSFETLADAIAELHRDRRTSVLPSLDYDNLSGYFFWIEEEYTDDMTTPADGRRIEFYSTGDTVYTFCLPYVDHTAPKGFHEACRSLDMIEHGWANVW